MALWFVSYATSPIIVIFYDVSIIIVDGVTIDIVYDVSTLKPDLWVIKLTNQVSPSIGFRVPHYGTEYSCGFQCGTLHLSLERHQVSHPMFCVHEHITIQVTLPCGGRPCIIITADIHYFETDTVGFVCKTKEYCPAIR